MYVTALRVSNARGDAGTNAFRYLHGAGYPWPADPWTLPDRDPGTLAGNNVMVKPGGNRVHAYLDVIAPDEATAMEIGAALAGLMLALDAPLSPAPNPVVYQGGRVVLRFGVENALLADRAQELGDLWVQVDPSTATWREVERAAG